MARTLRAAVYSTLPDFAPAIRALLQSNPDVRLVAEIDEPALIPQAPKQFNLDILIADLDPQPDVILAMVSETVTESSKLAIFAASQSTDGQLILSAMRSGVREFLTKPIDAKVLNNAIARIAERQTEAASCGKLITLMGTTGGVGTTTLAINLATELHDLSRGEVCVVDMDYRFGQVATFLDCEPKHTIADLCDSNEQLEAQVVEKALTRHSSGIRVLARPTYFGQADTITAAHCVGVLSALLTTHDYVVVDGPSRYDVGAKSVVDIADFNLLPLQLLVPSVRNTARMLEAMRDGGFDLARVKLICNRVRREAGSLSPADVLATLQFDEIFASIPDEPAVVSDSINLGEPLIKHSPKSKVRIALRELAGKLHGVQDKTDEKSSTRGSGLLSKIFSD